MKCDICGKENPEIWGTCVCGDCYMTPKRQQNEKVKQELELYKTEGSKLYFRMKDRISRTGIFKYSFRMFPKSENLVHRQDFCYVRWF